MAVTAESGPVLYQAALLVRVDSWGPVRDVLKAAGAVVEELPPASSRARRFDVSMPPPKPVTSGPVLTVREMEMLKGIARGLSNREISAELFIALDTTKTHVRNMLRKLGVGDRSQAVAVAYERGILGGGL